MKNNAEHTSGVEAPHVLHVLLAYDDARTCGAILHVLDRIATRLRAKTRLHVNAFRFGLLEQMDPLREAAAEVAVVAFGEAGVPGAGLLRWLERWGEGHADKDAALGLIPTGRAKGESVRRIVRILRRTAARHGLEFIYDAGSRLSLLQERETVVA